MDAYLGQFAAVATSLAWSFTSVFFTLSGRQVGSAVVNRTRLLLAVVFVMITHWLTLGVPVPLDAEPFRWGWLALSGLIGYVIGDSFLFQAFVMIGPRLSMLLMALAPVLSTILAWIILGETLNVQELLGIGLAVSGVALVVTDRRNGDQQQTDEDQPAEEAGRGKKRYYITGVFFGFMASVGQASGLFFSKLGLVGDFSALSGNFIRLITATVVIWIMTLIQGKARETFQTLRERPQAFKYLVGGATFGPFIGVWLSLVAVQRAPLGIATTLTSLAPVFLLPISFAIFKERVGLRAIGGTLLAVAGTALLFLTG